MSRCGCGWRYLMLTWLALSVGPLSPCRAQVAGGFADPFPNVGLNGLPATGPVQEGDWAEVVSITPKWLVIQNTQGQQFPVALGGIQLFVIRWPTLLDRVAPGALVEAYGRELTATEMQTDHLDVFEGAAANLVTPGFASQSTLSALAINYQIQTELEFNLFQPIQGVGTAPFMTGRMGWAHAVGPLVGLNPIRVTLGGNTIYTILATPNLSVTSVTPGSPSLVRAGDLVYFVPLEATPKSLNLSQLVVYKKVPQDQFTP